MSIAMTVRCPNGHTASIDPTTIRSDDFPMCKVCYMPAFPVSATINRDPIPGPGGVVGTGRRTPPRTTAKNRERRKGHP